jgi:glycerophosphoryl diester phosphodiesterase
MKPFALGLLIFLVAIAGQSTRTATTGQSTCIGPTSQTQLTQSTPPLPANAGRLTQPNPPLPATRHHPVVIAHRADHTRAPENTVAAIQDAIRCGVDYVELDLRTTRDGYLVLNHDASVDRMTGAHGKISDLTLIELKKLTVHNPGQPATDNHIPEFREALQACRNSMNIYLDFKEADVAETWRQIRAAGMERHIVVYLNKPEQYPQWRAIAPQMPLMTSLPDSVHTQQQITAFLQQNKIEVFDNVYDTTIQHTVRSKGVSLWLDAQGDHEGPADWKKLLSQNVQGIQTDHPEQLIDYLRLRAKANPANGRAADNPNSIP